MYVFLIAAGYKNCFNVDASINKQHQLLEIILQKI